MSIPALLAAAALVVYALVRRKHLDRLQAVAGAVVLIGLVLYGLGVLELPNIEKLLEDLGATLGPYTYVLVGALAFLETGAFIGLLAPGETAILVGGVVAGQGEIEIGWLIAIVWAAAVAGDSFSFLLGRRLGREFLLRHGPKVKITEERLHKVEEFFDRHGGKAILVGRFVGLVRAIAPFVAGASKMSYRRFLPYDVVGAGLWGTTFCLLGYFFWQSFGTVADYAGKGAFALATVIVVVVGVIAATRWLRSAENRHAAHAWLHEQSQRPLLRPLAAVARPVVYRVVAPVYRRARRPARFTLERFTPGDLGLELTTLAAVAAVGAYVVVGLAITLNPGMPYVFGDLRLLIFADGLRTGPTVDIARAITLLGDGIAVTVVATVAVVVLVLRRHLVEAAVVASGTVLTTVASQAIKAAEDRPRPAASLVDTAAASFPSGHAAHGVVYVAVAVALSRAIPSLGGRFAIVALALVIAVAVGLTRIYLRAHFLSDVLGGWGLAAAIFALCAIAGLLVSRVRDNRRE